MPRENHVDEGGKSNCHVASLVRQRGLRSATNEAILTATLRENLVKRGNVAFKVRCATIRLCVSKGAEGFRDVAKSLAMCNKTKRETRLRHKSPSGYVKVADSGLDHMETQIF